MGGAPYPCIQNPKDGGTDVEIGNGGTPQALGIRELRPTHHRTIPAGHARSRDFGRTHVGTYERSHLCRRYDGRIQITLERPRRE
jgi:hypothetical protein